MPSTNERGTLFSTPCSVSGECLVTSCVVLRVIPGNTPLHYAACRGVLNIIVRLLGSGAEPDMANVQGSTPLHKACMFGQNAVVKKLVE